MQKFKDLARRGTYLSGVVGLLAGLSTSVVFPLMASADALNPLTERTLLLSSSAPGYIDIDGSGNTTYAPPGSGANGKKSGETFTFKNSTDGTASPIKAFTFQYCTVAAGECQSPGNDTGGTPNTTPAVVRGSDDVSAQQSDLNVVTSSPAEVSSIPTTSSTPPGGVNPNDSQGNFAVEHWNGSAWVLDTGWSMAASNLEDTVGTNAVQTGKNNFITLTNTTGITPAAGTEMKVQFFATNGNYITNPGVGAYFVKINDYGSTAFQDFRDDYPTNGHAQNVIDGGVTVANVMNHSILIQTKVLETLDFSVGTHDPDTDNTSHGPCDSITDGGNNSIITLGDPGAENSLQTDTAHHAFSYWRLSSNSSNGATVYYSGNTLANTEGDKIGGTYWLHAGQTPGDNSGEYSHAGSEQFGLGLDVTTSDGARYTDDYATADSPGAGTDPALPGLDSGFTSDVSSGNPTDDYFNSWHLPQLYPLVPMGSSNIDVQSSDNPHSTPSYGLANGAISSPTAGARFAFDKNANTIPVPIASESTRVVNCSTGLMRYIGNIAATTPAGIYTTAINYLAAPEY